ncbi:MAG: hypothetical protein JWN96_1459 [Mycobacterium sp.]|jgi:hypothetical protein|nr:hypothetical protein [Mycobacterium sp.]
MNRKSRIVGGSCVFALVVAGGAIGWTVIPGAGGAISAAGSNGDSGVAGPLGPDAFSAFPTYFKRVTFTQDQLGQFQDIAIHLPAGRYLVEVLTSRGPSGSRPDCAGVAFPLVPSVIQGSFTGYVPVAKDGDAATVSCYERATGHPSATYHLFYLPVSPKSGAGTPEEHS